jgi:transcription elongation factor Elf1
MTIQIYECPECGKEVLVQTNLDDNDLKPNGDGIFICLCCQECEEDLGQGPVELKIKETIAA